MDSKIDFESWRVSSEVRRGHTCDQRRVIVPCETPFDAIKLILSVVGDGIECA